MRRQPKHRVLLPMVPADKLPGRDTRGITAWSTRARPKVDRIACPWLIRRFVDPTAVCLFVAPLLTPPLTRLATIVRGAGTGRPGLPTESAGLLAASLGLSRLYADDLVRLEAGMTLHDSFYRWRRDGTDGGHGWPPAARKKP